MGHLLGLPADLVEKTPIDGLCGKTDEENLGFTYAELDRYILTGQIDDPAKKERIDRLHRINHDTVKQEQTDRVVQTSRCNTRKSLSGKRRKTTLNDTAEIGKTDAARLDADRIGTQHTDGQ